MSLQLDTLVDPNEWQVAPTEFELANYDVQKGLYREYVKKYIHPLNKKSIRKKAFFTISTNVLCAEVRSSDQSIIPEQRDIYQPLEISITKWSFSKGLLETKLWMINPGEPKHPSAALDHQNSHKIDFNPKDMNNEYVEMDLNKIAKEINTFLTADRLVFSISLKYARQDLGCLKWLNRETGGKLRAIKVYSLEDLYVVVVRHLKPDSHLISQGVVRYRLEYGSDPYCITLRCPYHQLNAKRQDRDTRYCAKSTSQICSDVVIGDVTDLTNLLDSIPNSSGPAQGQVDELGESINQLKELAIK